MFFWCFIRNFVCKRGTKLVDRENIYKCLHLISFWDKGNQSSRNKFPNTFFYIKLVFLNFRWINVFITFFFCVTHNSKYCVWCFKTDTVYFHNMAEIEACMRVPFSKLRKNPYYLHIFVHFWLFFLPIFSLFWKTAYLLSWPRISPAFFNSWLFYSWDES